MNIQIGNLKISPALSRLDLVASSTSEALKTLPNIEEVGVAEIDPNLSDTAAFCEYYEVALGQAMNCVIVEAVRGERKWLAACLIAGNARADINSTVRKFLDARRVSFAKMDEAVSKTGMEYGGITPIGLPVDWPILIDSNISTDDYFIIGSGIRKSKLVVSGKVLTSLTNTHLVTDLAKSGI